MNTLLSDDESFLNFTYLTASFYNFVNNSGKNFKEINSKILKRDDSKKKNQPKKNNEDFDIEFDKLNSDNYMNYIENISLINNNDEEAKKNKLKLIKSVFNDELNVNSKDKLCYILSQKINCSMLYDKFRLVKFLSNETINFVFDIFELFYKVIKSIEESQKTKIQKLVADNLLEEERLKQEKENFKKKMSKENVDLKNKIEQLNQMINKIKKNEDYLTEKNGDLEKKIKALKENFQKNENDFNNYQKESKERELNLQEELKSCKSQVTILENTNNVAKEIAENIIEKSKDEEVNKNRNNLNLEMIDKIILKEDKSENKIQQKFNIDIYELAIILYQFGKNYEVLSRKIDEQNKEIEILKKTLK